MYPIYFELTLQLITKHVHALQLFKILYLQTIYRIHFKIISKLKYIFFYIDNAIWKVLLFPICHCDLTVFSCRIPDLICLQLTTLILYNVLSQQLLIQLIALFVTHVFISFDFEKLNDVTCLLSSGTIRVVNQIYKKCFTN